MSISRFAMILLAVLILVVQLSTRAAALPNTTMVYDTCWDTGTPLGPYADAVRRIRELLKTRTHLSGFQYRTEYHLEGVHCYGRAWCRPTISRMDCAECMRIADILMITMCANPIKALMGLMDCGLKIDKEPFTDE